MDADVEGSTSAAAIMLLLGSAFLSGAEVAFLTLGRHQVRQFAAGGRVGRVLARLLQQPARLLPTLVVANTALGFAAALVAARWALITLGPLGLPLAVGGMALLLLVIGQWAPMCYAQANAERVALAAALPLRALTWLLYVPTLLLVALANLVTGLLGGARPAQVAQATEAQVRALLTLDGQEPLEQEERTMIGAISDFGHKLVRQVMVPRAAIVWVEGSLPLLEAARVCITRRLSRLPVCEGDLDHVLGVVHAKDLLSQIEAGATAGVGASARPAWLVPDTKRADELLRELRRERQAMAIVRDEQGRTVGLVTLEDLLEEVVGEIYDEHDLARPLTRRLDERTWLLDGRITVDRAEELLGCPLPRGEYDTLAGLLADRLASQVSPGARVSLPQLTLVAEHMEGRQIAVIRAVLDQAHPIQREGQP